MNARKPVDRSRTALDERLERIISFADSPFWGREEEMLLRNLIRQGQIVTPFETQRLHKDGHLVNALKFRGDVTPRIHVGAVREGGFWTFSVCDNGIGIEPQYFKRIFVIFQRLHTRREFAGSGLGLAICKKIVERHGGIIWVESTLGKGTVVFFNLSESGCGFRP